MGSCVTSYFVKISILLVVLTYAYANQNVNSLKPDEIKKRTILIRKRSLQHQQRSRSPQDGKMAIIEENSVLTPAQLKKVASSSKGFRYNFKTEEEMSQISRRARKDVETETLDMTNQSVQCEVTSLSCRNCCENSSLNCPHLTKFCRCDSQCTFYNDCCVDYEIFCGKKQNISLGIDTKGLSCMELPEYIDMRSHFDRFWLISKCPWNRTSDNVSRNCENSNELELNERNVRNIVPVVGKNNLTYRNEFCAKCNGVEEFEYFGFNKSCFVSSKHCKLKNIASIFRKSSQPVRECNQYFRQLCPTLKELNENCKRSSYSKLEDCISSVHWCNLNFSKWNTKIAEIVCEERYEGNDVFEEYHECSVTAVSCRDCCENSKNCSRTTKYCRCDPQCNFYNDCCVDYENFCGKKHNISSELSQQGLSCGKLPEYVDIRSDFKQFWIINKCPKNRIDDSISRNCENANELDLNVFNVRNLVPVLGKNNAFTYRNEFCAKCNGVEEFEYFGFNITCSDVPFVSIVSLTELSNFTSKHCDSKIRISIFQKDHQPVRECSQYIRQLCPPLKQLEKLYNGKLLCSLRVSRWYNQVRQLCRKIEMLNVNVIPLIVESPIESYGILLNVKEPELTYEEPIAIVLGCPYGQFFDERLQICLYEQSRSNETCDVFFVALWLNVSIGNPPASNEIISSLAKLFNFESSKASEIEIRNIADNETRVVSFNLKLFDEQISLLLKTNYTEMYRAVSNSEDKLRDRLPLQRLMIFLGKFNIAISNETFTIFKTTSHELACRVMKISHTPIVNQEKNDSKSVAINVFSPCVGRRINLTSEDFIEFDNLSIFYKGTKTIYDFGRYDIKEGKIFICASKNIARKFQYVRKNASVIQKYFTLIGLVLSLSCLFLIILTYVIFRELRNLPTKNLLSLAVSLFLAQLLFLFINIPDTFEVCYAIAIIEHYLFLVSFVAMAVIAWDTHWVFASNNVRNPTSGKQEIKKFYKYSTIVWILPALFVAVSMLVDQKDIYAVYANELSCWFDNIEAHKYLFVLPVGLLLLFNVVFFALTIYRIQLTRSTTGLVQSQRKSRTMFWIYLKLSSLMGFSWLFGFIHLFVNSTDVFVYLFVIFATLQGVYIALAFVLKKEVWEKYKKLLERNNKGSKRDYQKTSSENESNTRETRV